MDNAAHQEPESAGRTIRDELNALRKMYPSKVGPVLRGSATPRSAANAILWVLLKSGDGEISLHKTLFHKKKAMTAAQWAHYMGHTVFKGTRGKSGTQAEIKGILEGAIIPGAGVRSGVGYDLHAVVGYALQQSIPAKILASWNQRSR